MQTLNGHKPTPGAPLDEALLAQLTGFVETAVPPPPPSPLTATPLLPPLGMGLPVNPESVAPESAAPESGDAVGGRPEPVMMGSAEVAPAIAPEGSAGVAPEGSAEEIAPEVVPSEGNEPEEVVDPRSVRTKQTLANSPFTRVGIVGGGVGLLVIVVVLFWNTVQGGFSSKPKPKAAPVVAVDEKGVPLNGDGQALADSKSENALNGQRDLLDQMNRQKGQKPVVKATPTPVAVATPKPAPPVRMVATIPPAPVTVPAPAPAAQMDPFAKWQQAAMVGSFGRVSVATVTPTAPAPSAPTMLTPARPANPFTGSNAIPTPFSSGNSSSGSGSAGSGARAINQLRSATDGSGLRSVPLTPVLVGTRATGSLTTGIILTSDNAQATNPNDPSAMKYLASLTQAVKDAKGADAIPAGALLVMAVSSFSPQSGTAAFQVTSVIVNNTEYTLPAGALLVRGENGSLLALDKRGGKGSGINLLGPLVAGLGQAATLINQPQSSSVVTSGVATTTTTSSGNNNLAAGFAQGAATSLSQQIQQQLQLRQSQQASNASVSWQAGVGTKLQLIVNASFEM